MAKRLLKKPRGDGDWHELLGVVGGLACGAIGWVIFEPPAMTMISFLVGGIFANYLASPDLDLRQCNARRRWRKLGMGWYWNFYVQAAGCHRSSFSHAPLIGTIGRLMFLAPLWLLLIFWMITNGLADLLDEVVIGGAIGFEVNALIHYLRDGTLVGGWATPRSRK